MYVKGFTSILSIYNKGVIEQSEYVKNGGIGLCTYVKENKNVFITDNDNIVEINGSMSLLSNLLNKDGIVKVGNSFLKYTKDEIKAIKSIENKNYNIKDFDLAIKTDNKNGIYVSNFKETIKMFQESHNKVSSSKVAGPYSSWVKGEVLTGAIPISSWYAITRARLMEHNYVIPIFCDNGDPANPTTYLCGENYLVNYVFEGVSYESDYWGIPDYSTNFPYAGIKLEWNTTYYGSGQKIKPATYSPYDPYDVYASLYWGTFCNTTGTYTVTIDYNNSKTASFSR